MQKKILAVAVALLLFVLGAVACGKKDKIEEDSGYAPFEYTTDEAGEKYVTNIYGDLIPVTTSENGAIELIEDLVTKTKEQAQQEKAEQEAEKNSPKEPAGDNVNNGDNGGNQGGNSGNQGGNSGGIVIGDDNVRDNDSHDAVIIW